MVKHRERIIDVAVLVVYLGSLALLWHHVKGLDHKRVYENCLAIENIKSGVREQAQATIDGDKLLLMSHDSDGTPLPVPRAAVLADIATKQAVVDRYPPRICRK